MHMRQTQTFHSINQGHTIDLELLRKCSNYSIYMVEYYYGFGGLLEIFLGCRLHYICSSFVFIVIIAQVRVGVVDDDVVFRANLLGLFVFFYWCRVSHEYSGLLNQVVILLH